MEMQVVRLLLPASAHPNNELLVDPCETVKHVARKVARLCGQERDPMQRWSLRVVPEGSGGFDEELPHEAPLGDVLSSDEVLVYAVEV